MVESLTDLPPNVQIEILSRLELKALIACRCVCKTFLNLTSSNPQYTSLCCSSIAAPQNIIVQIEDDFNPSKFLHLLDLDDKSLNKPIFEIPKNFQSDSPNKFALMNSCNGLLYFAKKKGQDEVSLVCNPITNEYVMIPNVDYGSNPLSETLSMMLGFSPGTNQYKVLRSFHYPLGENGDLGAQLLVVGSNSWRDIEGDKLVNLGHLWDKCHACLNGTMYWISYLDSSKVVAFFDFEREIFGRFVLSTSEFGKELRNANFVKIGVLGGCLCVCLSNYMGRHSDIWIMKEHGNQEFWNKEFVVDVSTPTGITPNPWAGMFLPLRVLRNGEILMFLAGSDLVCYDPKTKNLRFVGFYGLRYPKFVTFTPNFDSLKDTLGIDSVMVQDVRPRGDEMDL